MKNIHELIHKFKVVFGQVHIQIRTSTGIHTRALGPMLGS